MANQGRLPEGGRPFTHLKVAEGNIYRRVYLESNNSKIKITIKHDMPNIVDLVHRFHPANLSTADYFMRVSSTVKSNTLYHDSNGFLVAKRELNSRPDYQFIVTPTDRINANTYPVCSFAYFIENDKKMLFFSDRAQGVASY
jgi:hypothetical protein